MGILSPSRGRVLALAILAGVGLSGFWWSGYFWTQATVLRETGHDLRPLQGAFAGVRYILAAATLLVLCAAVEAGRRLGALAGVPSLLDPQTGAFSIHYFSDRLESEIARSKRYGLPLSVLLVEVDDTRGQGRRTTDAVITRVTGWLKDTCRSIDVVARYSDRQLAIILPHTDLFGAQELADRLAVLVERLPVAMAERTVVASVSIGVAGWAPGTTAKDLMEHLQATLQAARRLGRKVITCEEADALMNAAPARQW